MTISVNFRDQVFCLTGVDKISCVEMRKWLSNQMGIPAERLRLSVNNNLFITPPCVLDVSVRYTRAELYDASQSVVWSRTFADEGTAVRHLFVYLIQSGRLDLEAILDEMESNDHLQRLDSDEDVHCFEDASTLTIQRHLRSILHGESDEPAPIDTVYDLSEWCEVMVPDHSLEWTFRVQDVWE
jgi:hypothetical protein